MKHVLVAAAVVAVAVDPAAAAVAVVVDTAAAAAVENAAAAVGKTKPIRYKCPGDKPGHFCF